MLKKISLGVITRKELKIFAASGISIAVNLTTTVLRENQPGNTWEYITIPINPNFAAPSSFAMGVEDPCFHAVRREILIAKDSK
jgi:hypothetical protein